jgi:hypothetical protein
MSQPTRTTATPLGTRYIGNWSIWVQEAVAPYTTLDHYYARCDDFGNLVRCDEANRVEWVWYEVNCTDIDDASMLAYYPPEPAPEPVKPAVRVSITPEDEPGCWVASTISVQQTTPVDLTEPVYRLCIGREESVFASRRELQGLASACAELLGLQLAPLRLRDRRKTRAAPSACAH